MFALKSLLNNSNICVVLALASTSCLPSLSLTSSWFLIWWVSFNWNPIFLNIIRYWILFQSCVLIGKRGVTPCHCRVGVEVQVSSFSFCWGNSLLRSSLPCCSLGSEVPRWSTIFSLPFWVLFYISRIFSFTWEDGRGISCLLGGHGSLGHHWYYPGWEG